VAIARETPERIVHLHLKDVDARLAARVVEGRLAFSDAVRAGVFLPLGDGDVDVDVDVRSVLESVRGVGYEGWYVFEQDAKLAAEPAQAAGPRTDVARSLEFLHGALAGAAP
jgi:inosose dehydratase